VTCVLTYAKSWPIFFFASRELFHLLDVLLNVICIPRHKCRGAGVYCLEFKDLRLLHGIADIHSCIVVLFLLMLVTKITLLDLCSESFRQQEHWNFASFLHCIRSRVQLIWNYSYVVHTLVKMLLRHRTILSSLQLSPMRSFLGARPIFTCKHAISISIWRWKTINLILDGRFICPILNCVKVFVICKLPLISLLLLSSIVL